MKRSIGSATLGLFVSTLVLALSGCAMPAGGSGDAPAVSRRSTIVNGKPTANYPGAGVLLTQGQAFCTGTLIGPHTVLTAGHCVDQMDPSQMSFGFGPDASQIMDAIQVVSAVQHPNFDMQQLTNDVAVITLAQDAQVAPIPLNQSMDDSWVGRTVTLVGYGVSDGPSQTGAGIKREVDVTIDQVDGTSLHYTTQQGKTACNGDSGGPAFAMEGGQLVVAGITSYGDQNCKQYGVYTRVDAYLDFINAQIANSGTPNDPNDPNLPNDPNDPNLPNDPNDPNYPSDPNDPGNDPGDPNDPGSYGCQGETWEGRCEGNLVIWCEWGQVYAYECQVCGFVPYEGYYDCLE
ncbi:MAG: trypsin-like serine protease [Deltaproteobacteria bacterium]|nr:trypsin-like serine protease [Deltaproteobacteria bacterium]